MQPASDDRYVILQGGLALPVEPVVLLLDLETRGFMVARDGEHLSVRPSSKLTDDDTRDLKRWKHHVLALLDYSPPEVQ